MAQGLPGNRAGTGPAACRSHGRRGWGWMVYLVPTLVSPAHAHQARRVGVSGSWRWGSIQALEYLLPPQMAHPASRGPRRACVYRVCLCARVAPCPSSRHPPRIPAPENLLPVKSMAIVLLSKVYLRAATAVPLAALLLANVQFVQEKAVECAKAATTMMLLKMTSLTTVCQWNARFAGIRMDWAG